MSTNRKKEIEEKKAKLAALREEKKRKEEEKKKKQLEEVSGSSPSSRNENNTNQEADDVLRELGLFTDSFNSLNLSSLTNSNSSPLKNLIPLNSSSDSQEHTSFIVTSQPKSLTISQTTQTSIPPPKENVTYNKQTQTNTSESASALDKDQVLTYDHINDDEGEEQQHNVMPHVEMVKPIITSSKKEDKKLNGSLPVITIKELSEDEKLGMMKSVAFINFFNQASRVIERAITDDSDLLVDYSGASSIDNDKLSDSGNLLKFNRCFFDERVCKNREISSINRSFDFPELLAVSYFPSLEATLSSDGLVCIWNSKFKNSTPEYIFNTQSTVLSVSFAKFHPNLIVGACFSGQIVLWDNRFNKKTPIQRSPLSTKGHTHPVYVSKIVGTQNSCLLTGSKVGKILSWSLDTLSAPLESLDLIGKNSKYIPLTCFDFRVSSEHAGTFVTGDEDGNICLAKRHGEKSGVFEIFEGHDATITSVNFHQNSQNAFDFSNICLSSSLDWTVKLWSIKNSKPLLTFDSYAGYVYDVKWCPSHPAVFATCDGSGKVDLWNLNQDFECPIFSIVVDEKLALGCINWSPNGQQISVGASNGKVYLYDVSPNIYNPQSDEWSTFASRLQEMASNQIDLID